MQQNSNSALEENNQRCVRKQESAPNLLLGTNREQIQQRIGRINSFAELNSQIDRAFRFSREKGR